MQIETLGVDKGLHSCLPNMLVGYLHSLSTQGSGF